MKNQKPYIVTALIVCGLLSVGVSIAVSNYLGSSEKNSAVAADQAKNESSNYIQNRLNIMRARRPHDVYDPKEVAAAIARTDAWSTLKEIPKDIPLSKEEFADGREFIKFDSLKLDTLIPGDNLRLAVKQTGQQYVVNIDDVESMDENRTTWRGHIAGADGHNYEVSLTHGSATTVGGIDTPDGQYIVQAFGDKGWVAPSALLFTSSVNPVGVSDVVANQ